MLGIKKIANEINAQWDYLAPLGEERLRFFTHLMQVNNKHTHVLNGFEDVKKDIVKRKYILKKTESKYKARYDSVMKELIHVRDSMRSIAEYESKRRMELFENHVLRPSEIVFDEELQWRIIKYQADSISFEGDSKVGWTTFIPVGMNYGFEVTEKKKTYDYEEGMDVISSLTFSLESILQESRSKVTGIYPSCDIPKSVKQVVRAISSSIKKHDDELTESYLRGYKDARKQIN